MKKFLHIDGGASPSLLTFLLFASLLLASAFLTPSLSASTRIPRQITPVKSATASTDVSKVLVILAEFPDCKFTVPNPRSYYDASLNGTGFSQYDATGSVREWFDANSKGRFIPQFEVVGPVTLSQPSLYYGRNDQFGNDLHPSEMVEEACRLASSLTDFSRFDNDYDGSVDFIYVYHAGTGEATSGNVYDLWPGSGHLVDEGYWAQGGGVLADTYAFSNEWLTEAPDGIGTFLYQYLLRLGLPALSEPGDSPQASSPRSWDVMDTGFRNNEGRTPPYLSAHERMAFGWLEPETLTRPCEVTLTELSATDKAYRIPAGNDGNEYFLLEYRTQEKWDEMLPNHGMLVWHIDYDPEVWAEGTVNADGSHHRIRLVKPNDIDFVSDLDPSMLRVLSGWCYPGSTGATLLSDSTVPSMRNHNGEATGFPIADIVEDEQNKCVTFTAGDAMLAAIPVGIIPGSEAIGDDWFEASWNPVAGVSDYLFTVYQGKEKTAGMVYCDFGTGAALSFPHGWESSSTSTYTSATYCGLASPALRLKDEGAYLSTIRTPAAIYSFSFWARSVNASQSTLAISGRDADNRWYNICELSLPEEGQLYTFNEEDIPSGIVQLRFIFHRFAGAVSIDDVVLHYGETPVVAPGYDRVPVSATSYMVDQLPEDEDSYYFTVRAITDGQETPESVPVPVILGRADVTSPEIGTSWNLDGLKLTADAPVEVYTVAGVLVGRGLEIELPAPGLYIVRSLSGEGKSGSATEKVAVRMK